MLVQDPECDICGSNETDLDLSDCESCSSLYCDDCAGLCELDYDHVNRKLTNHSICKDCNAVTKCGVCGLSFCKSIHSGGICLGCDQYTCHNCNFDWCISCGYETANCCGGLCPQCGNMTCDECSFFCSKCETYTCRKHMSDCKCDDDTRDELICTCGQHKCSSKD